jgi:hypothetical protein
VRALPVAVTLMDQARAWKHDTDLGNRLTDPAFGLIGPITNHLVRSADAPHTAGFGDGGGIVIWLPGRVLTEGRAAAIEAAGAASQIPADCNPEVYDEGFWSRAEARAGQFGVTGPVGILQASEVPGAG